MPAKRSTKRTRSPAHKATTPSFDGSRASSPLASRIKRANRSTNTRPELLLRKALRSARLKFSVHATDLPGRPDFVFRGRRAVVFCDGDFWHGRNWRKMRPRLQHGSNSEYWIKKIAYNIARDKRQTAKLRAAGWKVVRVWETDVSRDPGRVLTFIQKRVLRRRMRRSTPRTRSQKPKS